MRKFILIVFVTNLFFLPIFLTGFKIVPEKHQISNKIIQDFVKQMNEKYGLKLMGTFLSTDKSGQYQTIGLRLELLGPISTDIGRGILVESTENLLDLINKTSSFKKYMNKYPFDTNNIEIVIFVYDKERNPVYYPKVFIFSMVQGNVQFKTKSKENEYEHFTCGEESYGNSKSIVEGACVPKSSCKDNKN
jgi:hypothetical protein